MMKASIIWLLTLWMGIAVAAQQKIITGTVEDANTQEKIPFAGVQFIHTNTGASADENGKFQFYLDYFPADSLLVSVLGYERLTLPVNKSLDSQHIIFSLNRTGYAIKEFVVHGGVNPALILLKKIIRHKPQNNNDRLESYKYNVYNKLELDINKIDQNKFLHSKFFKPFRFIFNNVDSNSEEKPFLPVFLTETLSDYYYQRSPKKTKEIIYASRTSGLENESVRKYLGSMYQNVNVYDNFIPVFDKKFVSPIANFATIYYNYELADTQYIDNRKCFQVTFSPKRKTENVFFGDFWVNDTTFAIQKMNLQVSTAANVNFVSRISVVQEYKPLNDTLWFLYKDKFIANFVPPFDKKLSLIGRKTTFYNHIIVNDTAATNIFDNKKFRDNIIMQKGALDKDKIWWSYHRPDTLSKNEKAIYAMVDTLQQMPLFRKYAHVIHFLVTGVKEVGPLELGPYFYEISANSLEKLRLRLDVGTNTRFSKNLYLGSYLAYGTADKKYKGSISALWLLRRHPRIYVYGSYTHDLDNGAIYYDEINTDNIFTLAVRKSGVVQKFVMVDEKRLEFYNESHTGFSQHLILVNKKFNPYAPLPDIKYFPSNGKGRQAMNNTEIGIDLRYAHDEKFLEGDYYRYSLGSDYPIVELKYSAGIPGVLKSNYQYHKLDFSVSDYLSIAPLGNLYYNVFGGKIYGTLPFTLLQVPPGNNLYYYDKYAFDMMLRYEFLCDQYAGFNIEHEIGGGIFNYIPLLRKLKLRQFWTAKGLIGNLSQANADLNFQGTAAFKTLRGNPYFEVGTGVENILHFFRIDFVWRITPKPVKTDVYHKSFGIFGSVRLQF